LPRSILVTISKADIDTITLAFCYYFSSTEKDCTSFISLRRFFFFLCEREKGEKAGEGERERRQLLQSS